MKKKILLGVIMILALACLFTVTAFAATKIDGIQYDLTSNENGNTAVVSKANSKTGCTLAEVVIPETVEHDGKTYTVTGFADWAFEYNTSIQTLVIKPKLTRIPNGTVQGATNLKKIYIDFSNVTEIGTRALTLATKDDMNPVSNQEFKLYTLESYGTGTDVELTELYLDKVVSIGSGAFNNTSLKTVKIGTSCKSIGIQTFRYSDLEQITVEGNIAIPDYFCGHNYSLKKINLQSPPSIGNSAFANCNLVEEVRVDLSSCTSVGGSAFVLSTKYDAGNTLTQWYNLDGEQIVDLSNLQSLGSRAFGSSNIGCASKDANGNLVHGTAKVIFPTSLKSGFTSGDSSTFRYCNITGNIYMNFADDAQEGIYIDTWALRGNYFETVVFGDNVKQINGQPLNGTKTLENVIFLADEVVLNDNIFNNCNSGINFYYKKITTTASIANKVDIFIKDGAIETYGACGYVVELTLLEGEDVTLNLVSHEYTGVADETVCPSGSLILYTCAGCKDTYEEATDAFVSKEHNFDLENGASVAEIIYINNNYFANGNVKIKCASCTSSNVDTVIGALFTPVGYSQNEVSGGFISHTVKVNLDNIAEYERLTGITVRYGLVASMHKDGKPIYLNGDEINVVDKAISLEMTNTIYTNLLIKINGITDERAVNCNAFAIINGEITYLCGDTASDTAAPKSLNIVPEVAESISCEAQAPESKQYA